MSNEQNRENAKTSAVWESELVSGGKARNLALSGNPYSSVPGASEKQAGVVSAESGKTESNR